MENMTIGDNLNSTIFNTLPVIEESLTWKVCYIIIVLFATVVGLPSNIIVLLTISRNPHTRGNPSYVYILNTAIAGIIITGFCTPVIVLEALLGTVYEHEKFCYFYSFLLGLMETATILSLTALGLHRASVVMWPTRVWNHSRAILIGSLCFIWGVDILCHVIEALVYDAYNAEQSSGRYPVYVCLDIDSIVDYSHLDYIRIFMDIVIPQLVTPICYIYVGYHIWRTKRKLRLLSSSPRRQSSTARRRRSSELRRSMRFLTHFLIFEVLFLASVIVPTLEQIHVRSGGKEAIAHDLVLGISFIFQLVSHALINTVLLVINRDVRGKYLSKNKKKNSPRGISRSSNDTGS